VAGFLSADARHFEYGDNARLEVAIEKVRLSFYSPRNSARARITLRASAYQEVCDERERQEVQNS